MTLSKKFVTSELRSVYIASSSAQAHLLANALRDREIDAFVENDSLQFGQGVLPFGTSTAPRVMVAEKDAAEARQIALELLGETATPAVRPMQFQIRTLFFVIGAVSIFLAIDRLTGWFLTPQVPQLLVLLLYSAAFAAIICIAFRLVMGRTTNDAPEDNHTAGTTNANVADRLTDTTDTSKEA